MKGKLISFSGIDSAGKTTFISLLTDYYEQKNVKYKVIWSRGGYTKGFEFLKKLIRKVSGKKLPTSGKSEKREEMLQKGYIREIWYWIALIDMIWLYAIVFRFYKIFGYTVVCDRYIWDTYVDFSFEYENKQRSFLWKLLIRCYTKPDNALFFYVRPEESLRRSYLKNEPFAEPVSKRVKRFEEYGKLMNEDKWDYTFNTESLSIDETWSKIKNILQDKQPNKN